MFSNYLEILLFSHIFDFFFYIISDSEACKTALKFTNTIFNNFPKLQSHTGFLTTDVNFNSHFIFQEPHTPALLKRKEWLLK